jgi:hypothetical protein
MMADTAPRRFAFGVLALILGVGMLLPRPSGASARAVTDSSAMAAVLGLITRIPAEIQGGAVYAETSVNLDKARARASWLYPGNLADAFLQSSAEEYRDVNDQVDAVAENPASSASTADSVGGGQQTPGGRAATLSAEAPSPKESVAIATGASSAADGEELVTYAGSTARTRSRVLPDDTVVTESTATLTGVRIAGVIGIGTIESRAVVTTPVAGEPQVEFATNVQHVDVAGVPAAFDQHGIAAADSPAVTREQVQQLNDTLAALADLGITIEAVPTRREGELGNGAVGGAALRVRYEAKKDPRAAEVFDQNPMYQVVPLPKELGYDEEFLLAQVSASSFSRPPADLGFDLDLGLDAGGPLTPGGFADGGGIGSSTTAAPVGGLEGASAAPARAPLAPEPAGLPPFALSGSTTDPHLQHLTRLYQLLFVFALAGAAAPRILGRAASG